MSPDKWLLFAMLVAAPGIITLSHRLALIGLRSMACRARARRLYTSLR